MFETKKSDIIWSWSLIGLNILALLWGLIPGLITMYDAKLGYVPGCLWDVPKGNLMENLGPLLIIAFIYCMIVGFIHLRNQSLGSIRGLFVGSVAVCVLSLMALLPHDTVQSMPYGVIPIILGVQSVASCIRMILVKREVDKLEEDY